MMDDKTAAHLKSSVETSLFCLKFLLMAHGPDVDLDAAIDEVVRGLHTDIDDLAAGKRPYLNQADAERRALRDIKFGLTEDLFRWPAS